MYLRHDLLYDTVRISDPDRSRQAEQRFRLLAAAREQRLRRPRGRFFRPAR